MADASWKALERRIAALLGGQRRGADYGDRRGGKNDVIHEHWSIEVKLSSRPTYSLMLHAIAQAEAAAEPGQEPIAIIKRKHGRDSDALVIQRLSTFVAWRGIVPHGRDCG